MDTKQLVYKWDQTGKATLAKDSYQFSLNPQDESAIETLLALYPKLTKQQILQDLLSTALDDIEAGFPYVKGKRVIAHDEEGDAIYEDAGNTPRFLALMQKHQKDMMRQLIAVKN